MDYDLTVTLFILIGVHFLADYPLQGDFLSKAKNHKSPISGVPWYQALTAHSGIQALGVGLVTGSLFLALLEFVAHWITDYGKSEGWYGFNSDQFIHIVCKAVWVAIIWSVYNGS